jgi:hypothetical protein
MGKVVDPGTGQPLHLSQCADLAVKLGGMLGGKYRLLQQR